MTKTTAKLSENRTVTMKSGAVLLRAAADMKQPIFIWGPPGIGKSDMVAQMARDAGAKLYDVRLSLMDPSDLKGILFYDPNSGGTDWSAPPDLPKDEVAAKYPMTVLFLDEMNSAPPSTQAAAYQLILNRRIGTYKLPENTVVVAAGNRENDRGVTYKMPAPLANRFLHMELAPDTDAWLDWALEQRIAPEIVSFIERNGGDLFNFDPKSPSYAFATPRSWAVVDRIFKQKLSAEHRLDMICGAIGEGLALKFNTHLQLTFEMPKPKDIIEGKAADIKSKNIGAIFSMVVSLCYALSEVRPGLDDDKWCAAFNNALEYIMRNTESELQVMFIHNCMTRYKLPITPSKLPAFAEFNKKNKDLIKAAS